LQEAAELAFRRCIRGAPRDGGRLDSHRLDGVADGVEQLDDRGSPPLAARLGKDPVAPALQFNFPPTPRGAALAGGRTRLQD
jgi:hypothetical protein